MPAARAAGAALVAAVALSLQGCSLGSGGGSSSGAAGGATSAASVPLNAAAWGDGVRLAISASARSPSGSVLPAQQLVLDTGSSTLAFCDRSLAQGLAELKTRFISCNMYNPGGTPTGYWGRFYRGAVELGRSRPHVVLEQSFYSVMEEEAQMPCQHGFSGIFGIAFKQLDVGYAYPGRLHVFGEGASDSCPQQDAAADLPPPLMQALQRAGGSQLLGIYWSGNLGESEGALYLQDAATSNSHYTRGPIVGQASLGEVGWYDISIQQIALSAAGEAWTDLGCDPKAGPAGNCILDTGTPALVVPPAVFAAINGLYSKNLPLGSLSVTLAGVAGGPAVTLDFDVGTLLQRQWISEGSGKMGTILGLPLWASYYTVFDVGAGTVTFVASGGSGGAAVSTSEGSPWLGLRGSGGSELENATAAPGSPRRLAPGAAVVV